MATITMATGTIITTTTDRMDLPEGDFFRLLAWTSPAYPVGGFSYSHGIEMAVEEGRIPNAPALTAYITTVLMRGAGHVDGVMLCAAHDAAGEDVAHAASEDAAHAASGDVALDAVAEDAFAWRGTAEHALEATQQGGSFASVTATTWPDPRFAAFAARHRGRLTHAVAFGAAAGFAGLARRPALLAYLHGFAANLVSAGVRLVPLGQTDGQRVTAALGPVVTAAAHAAEATDRDALATSAPLLDILSMRHETQYTRLFRS